MDRVAKLIYTDCGFLSKDEAVYQGYDEEDSYEDYGFTITGFEQNESGQNEVEDTDSGVEVDSNNYDVSWVDDEYSDNSEVEDNLLDEDLSNDMNVDNSDDWDGDRDEDKDEETTSRESYVFNGCEFKDPRQYIFALYKYDLQEYKELTKEEQLALARAVRQGMLCECSLRIKEAKQAAASKSTEKSHEFKYDLVDKPEKVLKRLKQTAEEKAWVECLSEEAQHSIIAEGRTAQEKLIICNLPLVIDIARKEHNQMEFLDRIQAGNEGLMKAIQYFDPFRGVKFSTYVTYLIRSEIRDTARRDRMQRSGASEIVSKAVTEDDIDKVCELMGGIYWMHEITVDTDTPADKIRKQIAVLLEQKAYAESIANHMIFSYSNTTYDHVLEDADAKADTSNKNGDIKGTLIIPDSDSDNKAQSDKAKEEKKLPRQDQLSCEDYVRAFFREVTKIREVPHDELAEYVLLNKKRMQEMAANLASFLHTPWKYTEEMAIGDLNNLIHANSIWPEWPLIKQMLLWGWKDKATPEDSSMEYADEEDRSILTNYVEYLDTKHPTETVALILTKGYIPLRQKDIITAARMELAYYNWLSAILDLTDEERLEENEGAIMIDLADEAKYKEIEGKYSISSKTVSKNKKEILLSIYDQIIESTNLENGDVFMKLLVQRYRVMEFYRWRKTIIGRLRHDHFTDKRPFKLLSRGADDSPRPKMEKYDSVIRKISEAATEAFLSSPDDLLKLKNIIEEGVNGLNAIVSSEAFQRVLRAGFEHGFVFDMGGPYDVVDGIEGAPDLYLEGENLYFRIPYELLQEFRT